jgi:hypothetical protein
MQIADNTGLNHYANNLAKNAPQEVLDRLAKLRDTLKQKNQHLLPLLCKSSSLIAECPPVHPQGVYWWSFFFGQLSIF